MDGGSLPDGGATAAPTAEHAKDEQPLLSGLRRLIPFLEPRPESTVVSLDTMCSKAQWGDIILFRCTTAPAIAQRLVTAAQWDHVGVVVSDGEGQPLRLVESCVLGCVSFDLKARVLEYQTHFADAVAWRRLLAPRTAASEVLSSWFTKESQAARIDEVEHIARTALKTAQDNAAVKAPCAPLCKQAP